MIEHMNERTTQPKSVLALGMFDGVHLAHQALVRQAAEAARALEAQTVAFTFTDAPGKLLHLPVTSLSTPAQRVSWLQAAGADRVDMVDFTQAFADLSRGLFGLSSGAISYRRPGRRVQLYLRQVRGRHR